MVREAWVQSQVTSYQRLLKCYLIPPCLILSNIRYVSRVKWSNPGNGVAPSPTPLCSSYRKGGLQVTFDYGHQLTLWRCPWYSRYRRREKNTATRVQILDKSVCISHCANIFGNRMKPSVLLTHSYSVNSRAD